MLSKLCCLALAMVVSTPAAPAMNPRPADPPPAASVGYAYDAAGRLAGVSQQQSARYDYDPNGNVTAIHRQAASALSVLSVVPAAGPAGATVTVHGTGFATPSSADTVSFGGVEATVTAATPTELTVTVPDGAASGPVSVSTSAGSAASRESFAVRGKSDSLSVTGVSPESGTIDTTVTISGTGFDTDPAADAVTFGHARARVTAASPTSLTVTVPDAAGSGPVAVAVGGQLATSGEPFLAVPSSLEPADMAVNATLAVDGAPTTVTLATQGKYALVRFDGVRGQRLSLGVTGATAQPYMAWVSFYDPYGASFARDEYDLGRWVDHLDGAYDLPPLPVSGSYELVVTPDVDNVGPVTLTMSSKVAGALAVDGAGTVVKFDRPGQETEFSLPLTKGQAVDFGFDQTSYPHGDTATVTIREPHGTPVLWDSDGTTAARVRTDGPGEHLLTAAETGTYTVVLATNNSQPGSFRITASTPADGGALSLGTARTVTIARPGQDTTLTYQGTVNEELGLDISGVTTGYVPYVTATAPSGAVLFSGQLYGHRDLVPLPATGTYRVTIGAYSTTGAAIVKLASRPVSSSITPTGPTVVSKIASKGGSTQLAFDATKDVPVSFAFTNWGFSESATLYVEGLDPNGDDEVEYAGIGDQSAFTFTPDHTGQYHLQLSADDDKSTGSVSVTMAGEIAGGTLDLGVEKPFSASRAGQPTRYTFAGTKGQKVSFVLGSNGFSLYTYVKVKRPDGQTMWEGSAWSAVDLDALPSTGTYQFVVAPYGETGSGQVRVAPRSSFPAATVGGAKTTLAVGFLGGVVETTFNVADDDDVTSLGMSGSDFDAPVAVRVLAPDGSTAYDGYLASGGFADIGTGNSGTYRLIMEPLDGDYGNASFTLSERQDAGTISLNSAKTVTLGRIGQTSYLRYNGTSGQKLSLSFAKMTTTHRPWAGVSAPDGSWVTDDGSSTNPVVLSPLPANGTYWIFLNPYSSPGSVTVTLANTAANKASAAKPNAKAKPRALPAATAPDQYRAPPIMPKLPKGGPVSAKPAGKGVVPITKTAVRPGVRKGLRPACATCSGGIPAPPGTAPAPGAGVVGGDPVDLATGLLVDTETDLAVSDTIPLSVTRTYRQNDTAIRDFGVGNSSEYNLYLYAPHGATSSALVLPDGGRISFQRLTPGGTGEHDYANAVFTAKPTPTKYNGAVMAWNGNGFDVRLIDGTVLVFGENAPLQAIRDRYGNTVTITRGPGTADQDTGLGLANGPIEQITTPHGRWVQFSHDSLGRITAAQDNAGRRVAYAYDSHGHLATVTDPTGAVSSYTYDASGRLATGKNGRGVVYLTNSYDANGRVVKQVLGDGGTYQFDYTLDAAERLVETRATDPIGTVRRFTFNSAGYQTSETDAYGTSLAQTTTTVRDPVSNLPTSVTDPLGRRTDTTYDEFGQPTSRTEQAGTSAARTERRTYAGPFHQPSQSVDAMGRTTTYSYRPDGSPATSTDPMSRTSTIETNADGQVTRTTDPVGHSTSATYVLGDLTAVTDQLGRVSRREIDAAGWIDGSVDPLGAVITFTHDADGRILSSTDPLGQTTSTEYDGAGNATKITDARGHATSSVFDAQNRLLKATDPLSRTTTYAYDKAGNRTSTTAASGAVVSMDYDALGRLSKTRYPDSTITYGYDNGGRVLSVADSKAGTITNVYDGFDRKTRATTPLGRIDYTYDVVGDRTGMTVAGQPAVAYTFNTAGQLIGESQGANSVAVGYDPAGRRGSVTLPDGVVQSYTYDAANELVGIDYSRGSQAVGDLTYAYDAAGRVSSAGGSYARAAIPQDYGPATYDAANQLTSVGGTASSYDKDGNLLSNGTTSYVWNSRGQLASSATGGKTTTYGYDALGRRTSKNATNYFYDGTNVVTELTGTTVTASMLTGGVDEVFARTSGGTTRSLLTDRIGSTVAVADPSGAVSAQYTYEPFGATTVSGDDGGNPTRFTGREDDGGGQYYYRARYYGTDSQRFLSADPSGFAGGDTNLYAYTGARPTAQVDPLGLSAQQAGGGFLGWLSDAWNWVWTNRTWFEVGFAVIAVVATAAAAVVTAPVWGTALAVGGTVATVAGIALSAADTVDACVNGEKLSCGAGIAGLALGGTGAAVDRASEAFLKSLGEAGAKSGADQAARGGPAAFNVWNWGSIWFTGIGGWAPKPEEH